MMAIVAVRFSLRIPRPRSSRDLFTAPTVRVDGRVGTSFSATGSTTRTSLSHHLKTCLPQAGLDVGDAHDPEVEHRGGEHRVGPRLGGFGEVFGAARSAGGDEGAGRGLPEGPEHLQVEAFLRAVGIDGVQEDLPDPRRLRLGGPFRRVDPRAAFAPVGGHVETTVARIAAAGVDGEHERLGAAFAGDLGEEFGAGDRGGVHRYLRRARLAEPGRVCGAADPTPDRDRDADLRGEGAEGVQGGGAALQGCRNVEEGELVGALGDVPVCEFDGVPRILQVGESHAFDDPPAVEVEAGDDADGVSHQESPSGLVVARTSMTNTTVSEPNAASGGAMIMIWEPTVASDRPSCQAGMRPVKGMAGGVSFSPQVESNSSPLDHSTLV